MFTFRLGVTAILAAAVFTLPPRARAQSAVTAADIELRNGIAFALGSSTPFSGAATRSFPDGQAATTTTYVNGIRVEKRNWHQNGMLSSHTVYDGEGQIAGTMRHWDGNGTLRESHAWVAGKENGQSHIYDHRGNLVKSGSWTDGVRHGEEVWYYTNGAVRWTTMFDRGNRTGVWIQYGENGKLLTRSTWESGKLVSRG